MINQKEPREPKAFPCMDDDPRNNGNGYNSPNPYDNYEELEPEEDEEEIPDEQE